MSIVDQIKDIDQLIGAVYAQPPVPSSTLPNAPESFQQQHPTSQPLLFSAAPHFMRSAPVSSASTLMQPAGPTVSIPSQGLAHSTNDKSVAVAIDPEAVLKELDQMDALMQPAHHSPKHLGYLPPLPVLTATSTTLISNIANLSAAELSPGTNKVTASKPATARATKKKKGAETGPNDHEIGSETPARKKQRLKKKPLVVADAVESASLTVTDAGEWKSLLCFDILVSRNIINS
jgi:hypothetical protein